MPRSLLFGARAMPKIPQSPGVKRPGARGNTKKVTASILPGEPTGGMPPRSPAQSRSPGNSGSAHSPVNPAGKTRGWAKTRPSSMSRLKTRAKPAPLSGRSPISRRVGR